MKKNNNIYKLKFVGYIMKKRDVIIISLGILIILILPLMSAGFFDNFFDKLGITGKAGTQPVTINITVTSGSAPTIPQVSNFTSTIIDGPNEGPNPTYISINFTAKDTDGFGNLDDNSATATITKSGETNRTNMSCAWWADYNTEYANYTCNITMWWFDGAGDWTIHVNISDAQSNIGTNSTKTFSVGTTDGLTNNITSVNFPSISPGATDTASTNNAYLNNTGNMNQWLEVNVTNVVGESNAAYLLGASNFSVNGTSTCAAGVMTHNTYLNISDAELPKGNYTLNDGTAQEILFFCIKESNSDLEAQYYSTGGANSFGPWIIKVVNQ